MARRAWVILSMLLLFVLGACGGPKAVAAPAADHEPPPDHDGCGAHAFRLGADCWSAEGTHWEVIADGPAGRYAFELELLAAGRARAADHEAASPATDEWFQDGPLLRVFLSDRFVEYRANVTNGTMLVGEAMNVRGQRWAWRARRLFDAGECREDEARLERACMTVAGTRWRVTAGAAEPVLVEFLASGLVGAGAGPSEDRWTQEGATLRFSLDGGARRFEATLEDDDTLSGAVRGSGAQGDFSAARVPSLPPLARR